MTSEQIQELVKKALNAHYLEAVDDEVFAVSVDEQIAIARLVDSYTHITAVVEAEKKWRREEVEKTEMFQALLESTAEYIEQNGVPMVLMQMIAQNAGPPDAHIPPQVVELARQMGAEVVCGCPGCSADRKKNGH